MKITNVAKIANRDARQYVEERAEFIGSNLMGVSRSGDVYEVLSYHRYPILAWARGFWYENTTKISVTTSKQLSQCRPNGAIIKVCNDEMEALLCDANERALPHEVIINLIAHKSAVCSRSGAFPLDMTIMSKIIGEWPMEQAKKTIASIKNAIKDPEHDYDDSDICPFCINYECPDCPFGHLYRVCGDRASWYWLINGNKLIVDLVRKEDLLTILEGGKV